LNDQSSGDSERANRSGWNCDTHYEYEGAPAVDFYIPDGTPIIATMDGTATLNVISTTNDFDRYGVDREPYLGNPDRVAASASTSTSRTPTTSPSTATSTSLRRRKPSREHRGLKATRRRTTT